MQVTYLYTININSDEIKKNKKMLEAEDSPDWTMAGIMADEQFKSLLDKGALTPGHFEKKIDGK